MRRALLLLALLPVLAGCAQSEASGGEDRFDVVATTNFIADAAQAIGGDRAEVTALMGPGVDPHAYRASAGDVEKMVGADLILYGGLELEGKMGDVFAELSEARRTVAVTRDIPRSALLGEPGREARTDPHVWFDPLLWKRAMRTVADAYIDADPAGERGYRRRLARYLARIDAAHEAAKRAFAAIPPRSRVLVTSHDAFGYFGRRYGFEVVAIQGISTAAEATTADIRRVAEVVARRRVKAVFIESSVPRQTIEAVIAAAERLGQPVRLGGELYSDAAGDAGTVEGTYPGMLLHNARLIAEGLR